MRQGLSLLLLLGSALAGFALTRVGARSTGESPFTLGEWPARGSGEVLVEYFDPGCAISQMVHADLDRLFTAHPEAIRHVMVPVKIVSESGVGWAEVLCASEHAWSLASRLVRVTEKPSPDEVSQALGRPLCHDRVQRATNHLVSLQGQRVLVPAVEYREHLYVGLPEIQELLAPIQGQY